MSAMPNLNVYACLLWLWQFEMHTVVHSLSTHLSSQHVGTLVAAVGWIHMLLRKSAARVMQLSIQVWPALFDCLSNPSEEVVRLDIEALAIMASSTQQVHVC